MGKEYNVKKSKHLALILRHNPKSAGITLDSEGWTDVKPVLVALGIPLPELEEIVRTDSKGRYTIKGDKIRANQGHSVKDVMAVDLTPVEPPSVLFHGTSYESWILIQKSGGLNKMNRHHVHMTDDRETAKVNAKRWKGRQPVILWIDSDHMHRNGHDFFVSDNGVWMTDEVPVRYIRSCESVKRD